jgi:hypothetical protein
MADDDPVGAVDFAGRQADRRRGGHAVDVRVEEDDEVGDGRRKVAHSASRASPAPR